MNQKTVTRAHLAEELYSMMGMSRNDSAEFLEDVLSEISECLIRGETVKLSSFGTFLVRHKNERIGRNPKTGEEVPIESRRVLVFRASNILKSRVNLRERNLNVGGA